MGTINKKIKVFSSKLIQNEIKHEFENVNY